jgi:hypothetical protein
VSQVLGQRLPIARPLPEDADTGTVRRAL